jgi:hypothetical protein
VLQQGAAGRRRRHALAAAHEKRRAEGFLHVADARRGGGQRQMGALGAVRDAAGLDHMAKQTEIDEIEMHPTSLRRTRSQSITMTNCVKAPPGANFVMGEVLVTLMWRCSVLAVPLGTGRARSASPDRR